MTKETTDQQIARILDAFSYEMADRYWHMTPEAKAEQFRQWIKDDLERLVTIVRAVRD